ncbi:ATP-binding protein [Actinomadura madurae]|uniref:BbrUII/HgiDII family restriction enzyme n=1 Tax=Actinomadura madurae TaxID=1993 RepID=UPI00399A64A8
MQQSPDPYEMTVSLNVLNHLGLNLYSNIPAVLSEVVANAYDADASTVHIDIDRQKSTVSIFDDGMGMTRDDINERFLNVGFERRNEPGGALTVKYRRPVMGRKGIGKLSLFSVAQTIDIYTTKDGEKNALRMRLNDVREAIKAGNTYHPEPLDSSAIDFSQGTRIILSNLKKELIKTEFGLRQRLARRFSVIGAEHGFRLFVNQKEVQITDRGYFNKLQYVWIFDQDEARAQESKRRFTRAERATIAQPSLDNPDNKIWGWIGTTATPVDLREPETGDNLNKVILMVRGKLAHEDVLEELSESSHYRSYLIGELHCDFLDLDNEADIATSSRQRIIEDDPRYRQLIVWLSSELSRIKTDWGKLRDRAGTSVARRDPAIDEWFETLGTGTQKKARKLFGKINQVSVGDEKERRELFAHSVLAFESLRVKDALEALDEVSPEDLAAISQVFTDVEHIEALLYHQIVSQRLGVIKKLDDYIDEDALERILQEHLYENLWLLDPSWERATDRHMEEKVGKAFQKINAKLTKEEQASRIDIRYKRVTGVHVIVELKRYSVTVSSYQLAEQVDKYKNALELYLSDSGIEEPVEVICVVGRDLRDWNRVTGKNQSRKMLEAANIRVLKYDELLRNSSAAYREYLEKQGELDNIRRLLNEIAKEADST